MLRLQRTIGERCIVDLGPLIEAAVEAAGSNGKIVRDACKDFLQGSTTFAVIPLEVRGKKTIGLGFDAPKSIPIHREEKHEEMTVSKAMPSRES